MPARSKFPVGCTIFASTGDLTNDVAFVKMGVIIASQYCPEVTIQQLSQLEKAVQASPLFAGYELHQTNEGNIIISVDVPAVRRGAAVVSGSKVLAELVHNNLNLRCTTQMLPSQWHIAQLLGGRTQHTPEQ